jgi:hypothetical protein
VPRITRQDVAQYEAELAEALPGFAVLYKDESRLQQTIARLIKPFNGRYMTDYTTVMFGRVYFPSRIWRRSVGPERIYATLRHEAVHLRDMRRFPVLFQLSYLFLLPGGLTVRAWWEWRAYAETLRVELELTGQIPDHLIEHIAQRFTGADYLFMWPFPRWIRRRLNRLRDQLIAESG